MPVRVQCHIYNKGKPKASGTLVSEEMTRFTYISELGETNAAQAFRWLTYHPGPSAAGVFVTDYRFEKEDGGDLRIYTLWKDDMLPFTRDSLPKWRKAPQNTEK